MKHRGPSPPRAGADASLSPELPGRLPCRGPPAERDAPASAAPAPRGVRRRRHHRMHDVTSSRKRLITCTRLTSRTTRPGQRAPPHRGCLARRLQEAGNSHVDVMVGVQPGVCIYVAGGQGAAAPHPGPQGAGGRSRRRPAARRRGPPRAPRARAGANAPHLPCRNPAAHRWCGRRPGCRRARPASCHPAK